jgi:serine/threonine protein kinase
MVRKDPPGDPGDSGAHEPPGDLVGMSRVQTQPAGNTDPDLTVALSPGAEGARQPPPLVGDTTERDWGRLRVASRVGRNGKFRLDEEIGKGGMGKVFRAADLSLHRDVAIKFPIPSRTLTTAEVLAQCYREARAIARMDDENIVRIWELDDQGDPPFIVMEYLRGRSLEHILREGRLSDPDVRRVMMQVAKGLGHAHTLGVLHRDLKPSNIFVLDNGHVKLLDFGLARLNAHPMPSAHPEDPGALQITFPRAGTAPYMAPEQWRGEDADVRTDVWSALVILFHLLSGQFPFAAQTASALSEEILSANPPPSLRRLRPELPARFLDWFERAFAKDPAVRCQSADDLAAGLLFLIESGSVDSGAELRARPVEPVWDEFWTGAQTARSLLHLASARSALAHWQKAILLFIEEDTPRASCQWDDIPRRTLRAAAVDVDTMQYTLSGDPAAHGWFTSEAAQLRLVLETELRKYRHIFLIARDLGMLVAKRVLAEAHPALISEGAPTIRQNAWLYPYRVRQLIQISDTAGGSRPTPVVSTADARADADAATDRNRIEHDFLGLIGFLRDRELPRAAFRHVSFKLGSSSRGPREASIDAVAVVPRLADLVSRPDLVLARESIAQSFELDCANKIQLLVDAGPGDPDRAEPTIATALAGAQSEIYETLRTLCEQTHERPPCVVVTGDAGVGKSTVLRRLTRKLSSDYLDTPDGDVSLPVFIPLYFVILDGERLQRLPDPRIPHKGELLLDLLLDWWCHWSGNVTYQDAVPRDWLERRLQSEPTVVILDGADEFLTNHPALGPADVQMLLHHITTTYAQNSRLSIVLGVRSSQPSLLSMASGARYVYEILRLTPAQAETYFPAARDWVTGIHDAQVKGLLLTPLLLAHLDSRVSRPAPGHPATRTEILERVLLTIVEQSGLPRLLRPDHAPADAAQWVVALMLVAWRMFARLRGEIFVGTLRDEAREAIAAWERHLDHTGSRQQARHLLSSFALLCDAQTCDALVRRTVLYPTGHDEVRFIHREWQDFLTSRYLAECVRWRYVDELGHRAFTLPTFMTAGELLGKLRIEVELVREVERRTQDTGQQLIHANFCALLGNSHTPMSGPAMELIFGDLARMAPLSRLVTIASFGNRVLNSAPDDPSVVDLRRQLISAFIELARDEAVDRFYRSQAWCYLKAIHAVSRTSVPEMPWPGLGEHAEDERAALELMCDLTKTPPEVAPRHRSLQIAWLQIQSMIVRAPHRPISAAHYLYTIVIARRHGVHIAEVSQELPAIFADDSFVARAYRDYALVPELWTIFERCRAIFLADYTRTP